MRDEYKIDELNPRNNPYTRKEKQQVTINLNISTIDYFKSMASECGIPYQTLINMYLDECVKENRRLQFI